MIDVHRIVYNNLSSDEFDVIPGLSFNGDDGATATFLNREGVYTEHYDGHRTIHRAKYNEAFTPRFTLIKNDYSDFNADENRKILSWLTASDKPGWLEVYKDDSNVLEWRVFGCVTNVEQYKLGNGRIVGYEFEIESSHPYAYSCLMTWPSNFDNIKENEYMEIDTSQAKTTYEIECETDEYGKAIYPKVTIVYDNDDIYFPVPDSATVVEDPFYDMIPNVIYSYKTDDGKTAHRVNANGEKRPVISVSVQDIDEADVTLFYHFLEDHTIRKVSTTEDKTSRIWEIVGIASAAVQIENVYTLNGEDKSSKTVISGGSIISTEDGTIGETIVLDGTNKVIYNKTSADNGSLKIIGDHFNWEWVPLAFGTNNITVTGKCKIKFEWIEPRKVGNL